MRIFLFQYFFQFCNTKISEKFYLQNAAKYIGGFSKGKNYGARKQVKKRGAIKKVTIQLSNHKK